MGESAFDGRTVAVVAALALIPGGGVSLVAKRNQAVK